METGATPVLHARPHAQPAFMHAWQSLKYLVHLPFIVNLLHGDPVNTWSTFHSSSIFFTVIR
jgi:hypothetical protein